MQQQQVFCWIGKNQQPKTRNKTNKKTDHLYIYTCPSCERDDKRSKRTDHDLSSTAIVTFNSVPALLFPRSYHSLSSDDKEQPATLNKKQTTQRELLCVPFTYQICIHVDGFPDFCALGCPSRDFK
jgi:hypothetical protein